MTAFFSKHLLAVGMGSMWIFSAFVAGMPEPDEKSSKSYRWAYNSLHFLAANLNQLKK